MSRLISKSKYLNGLQCPKLLWAQFNANDQIPAFDAATQAIFDQGHEVGRLAQSIYPGGTAVAWNNDDFAAMLKATQDLLAARHPLYEATFGAAGAFARADARARRLRTPARVADDDGPSHRPAGGATAIHRQ